MLQILQPFKYIFLVTVNFYFYFIILFYCALNYHENYHNACIIIFLAT